MKLRFLETCRSDAPDVPFMAGQVIDVPALSPPMRTALERGYAELIPTDDTERAVEPDAERTEPERAKGRRHVRM